MHFLSLQNLDLRFEILFLPVYCLMIILFYSERNLFSSKNMINILISDIFCTRNSYHNPFAINPYVMRNASMVKKLMKNCITRNRRRQEISKLIHSFKESAYLSSTFKSNRHDLNLISEFLLQGISFRKHTDTRFTPGCPKI